MGKKTQVMDAKGRRVIGNMVKAQNELRRSGGPTLSQRATRAVINANVKNVK